MGHAAMPGARDAKPAASGPQCEATGFEQYQSARAKLAELGLIAHGQAEKPDVSGC